MNIPIPQNGSFISYEMLNLGIKNTLLEKSQNIFLFITDFDGNVLMSSDNIANPTSDKDLILSFEKDDSNNGGIIVIKNIPPERTKNFISDNNSHKAYYFSLASCDDTIDGDSPDGVTRKFPNEAGSPKDIYIIGELLNNPIIFKDTRFQFNESKIAFRI